MSQSEKARERLRQNPKDYTFTEARALLTSLGFKESSKGRTSGSRVRFYREADGRIINLHKPHPQDTMKPGAVKQLVLFLREIGEL